MHKINLQFPNNQYSSYLKHSKSSPEGNFRPYLKWAHLLDRKVDTSEVWQE